MSLIFLLYGDNPANAKYGLQRLLILYHCQHSQNTDILSNWILSRNDSNWRLTIIEALWTIKAKHVLQMVGIKNRFPNNGIFVEHFCLPFQLGLDIEDLHTRFLHPSNAEVNLHIHPILKALYCICERLVPNEAKLLIDYVNSMDGEKHPINFTDEKYLEIFLLHWLAELVIEAGEWSLTKSKRNVFCQLDSILEFLNSNKPQLGELLNRVIVRFNFTSNNVTSVERKKNVTDDDGCEDDGSAKAKRSVIAQRSVNDNFPTGSNDRYRIERDTAGYVLIINQIEFYRDSTKRVSTLSQVFSFEVANASIIFVQSLLPQKPLEKRHGTNKDKKALHRTFSALGYKIVEKENLRDDQILDEVKQIVTKSGSSDSLIVCILSHGSEG